MIVRRDRIHHQGKTNRDFKMLDSFKNTSINQINSQDGDRIASLSVPKNKKFSEILDQKSKRIVQCKDPVEETKNSAKKFNQHHLIGYPRSSHLEEKELMKRVFCGDSNTLFFDEEHRQSQESPVHKKYEQKEKLAQQKREENTTGIQETQLVGLENKNTLEGKVDLEKVRDIRRAIRRRYANRKNFQKIFNLWDEDSNGAVSVKNLYNMIQRLGININIDEARVLLASADMDGSNDLGLDEFLDLIFNDKDALNVNLKALPALTEDEKDSLIKNQETIDFLRNDALQARDRRHQNQVNLILKNRLQQLGQQLTMQDELQKGYISFGRFERVIKKLEIDPSILSDHDLKILYDNFKNQDDTFDYKKFLNHLKSFQLQEEVYNDPYSNKNQEPVDKKQLLLKSMKYQEDQLITLFDITRVDAHSLEKMKTKTKNLMNKIQRYIPSNTKFEEFLKSKIQGNNVNVKEFSHVIIQFLESVNERYQKFDLESMLSVLQFSQYETQRADEIVRILFSETDQEFYDRAQLRQKGPAPPEQVSKVDQALQAIDNKQQDIEKQIKFYNQDAGMTWYLPNQSKELSDVLMKVENSLFNRSERAYKLFKDFDKDKDGYISQQDMKQKLEEMNILNGQEIGILINYVDPSNKGYATFSEFHDKLRAGMTIVDNAGNQLIQINSQPGKTFQNAAKTFLPELSRLTEEFKKPFRPQTNHTDIRPSTRFGATPAYKNTFVNFVPPKTSPMFMTQGERFSKNREQFIQDEKSQNNQKYENKLNRIRQYHQSLDQRIQSAQEQRDQKDASNLKSKQMAQWTYEHKAHLKNDYL
ncbi:unnamed protein product [Paramecium octaurelia]|uniref:EF-hand domain-containing protein n=1 Tax=Paramecium octaurelia TaxID=43137 RepID=A0A8S1S4D9_PAROT|nr:unnamed protein product [Paramecium octaurelia]